MEYLEERKFIGIICDRETATCFHIGGIPLENKKGEKNILMIDDDTGSYRITEFYDKLMARKDIAIIFVGFDITHRIRNFKTKDFTKIFPIVLRIPTKTTLENHSNNMEYMNALYPILKLFDK